MKALSKIDQDVLRLLSDGVPDREICVQLQLTVPKLKASIERIEERARVESDNAGRLYERALKTRMQQINESLDARFHALMDVLPHAVLVIDGRTGLIKDFNKAACDLFGYSSRQLSSLSVEKLVVEEFRSIHPSYRIGFLSSIRKREMGYHPPIFAVRRDGSQVEMAIALTATPNRDDVMVVCTEVSKWTSPLKTVQASKVV